MQKVNLAQLPEEEDQSPKGKFHSYYKGVSLALGRDDRSLDLSKRHPFDLEYNRIPPGAANYPFHFHSAQWEMYVVVSGRGVVRDEHGTTEVTAGDAFVFPPCQPHQLSNPGPEDLVYYVIADNPLGECCYYPDSKKWLVARETPARKLVRDDKAAYYEGEE
ncbi:MAG TPA: cupin domain-containing protein [Opitutales bacterium]|nr:cupin domain-containing protein [Opitutales bacterium]